MPPQASGPSGAGFRDRSHHDRDRLGSRRDRDPSGVTVRQPGIGSESDRGHTAHHLGGAAVDGAGRARRPRSSRRPATPSCSQDLMRLAARLPGPGRRPGGADVIVESRSSTVASSAILPRRPNQSLQQAHRSASRSPNCPVRRKGADYLEKNRREFSSDLSRTYGEKTAKTRLGAFKKSQTCGILFIEGSHKAWGLGVGTFSIACKQSGVPPAAIVAGGEMWSRVELDGLLRGFAREEAISRCDVLGIVMDCRGLGPM